jgi:Oxidoreductase molybdopterin binding domain
LIAETSSKELVTQFITPNENFFVRGHQAIPDMVDPETFCFSLFNDSQSVSSIHKPNYVSDEEDDDENLPFAKLSLNDLKTKFKPHRVMNAMSCAGNRRKGMKEFDGSVQGNDWYVGAIGNAVFSGVLMCDMLKEMGFDLDKLKDKHLIAESMDVDVQGKPF